MKAGRELDALIAKKIMGWKQEYIQSVSGEWHPMWKEPEYLIPPGSYKAQVVPPFSTDLAAAWKVVKKLMEYGDVFIEFWSDDEWFVANKPVGVREDAACASCDGRKTGESSVPLAICRAALKIVCTDEH